MSSDAPYYRLAGRIFADFSGTIAVPAVSGALLGKWLDARYGTEPRYLLVFLTIALVFTGIAIVRKAQKYTVQYEALMKRKN